MLGGVRLWWSRYEDDTRTHVHVVDRGFGHAVLAQVVAFDFRALRLGASICDGIHWWPIYSEPALLPFELEHGADIERNAYNARAFAEVMRTRTFYRGTHLGLSDLFFPIASNDELAGILVVGPFLRAAPTSASVTESWRQLTGRRAHPSDPEFAAYLEAILHLLVLDEGRDKHLEELLDCFVRLLILSGKPDELANRADVCRAKLEEARLVERRWEVVRTMVDERTSRAFLSASRAWGLRDLGLPHLPDQALVGLTTTRRSGLDPVEEAIRRYRLQRKVVDIAAEAGKTVAGRVGGHGVVFLSAAGGSRQRKLDRLGELAERTAAIARRELELSMHFGASVVKGSISLSQGYQSALGAAQSALTARSRMIVAEQGASKPTYSLRQLHEELARLVQEKPEEFAARSEHYLETVTLHCGHRIEPAQAHLEVGFERIAEALLKSGTLDQKSFVVLRAALDREASEAGTYEELIEAHRRALSDLAHAAARPVQARHDRNLQSALDYIQEHYAEPLDLKKVAKVAGFSAPYFSELFAREQKVPFENYVRNLRLERAKQLLAASDLEVTRVAELSGFNSLQYFSRVFRAAVGVVPREYRKRSGR